LPAFGNWRTFRKRSEMLARDFRLEAGASSGVS
jgi:hypothetical protein